MQNSSKINLGNKLNISFNAFIINPSKYIELIKSEINDDNKFARKENEQDEKYYHRIFKYVYDKQNTNCNCESYTRKTASPLSKECVDIINAMDMSISKVNIASINVESKNTGNKYRFNRKSLLDIENAVKKDTKYLHKHIKNINIGVELEFIGDQSKLDKFCDAMSKYVGEDRFERLLKYNKNKGDKWILGKDSSVHGDSSNPYGYLGFELTSPIYKLSSKKDMKELAGVCNIVKIVFGGLVNKTCGTHIHMSFKVNKVTRDMCYHFSNSYLQNEESLFDKLVPKNRREDNSEYCESSNPYELDERYVKLNMSNTEIDSNIMHLEFRQLDGTLDFNKIKAWCLLQKAFVEITLAKFYAEKKKCNNIFYDTVDLKLEELIVSDEFDMNTNEELMQMSNILKLA